MLRYAQLVGYTETNDQFFFVDVMRACDSVYRAYSHEQAERESKKRKASTPSQSPRRR